MKWGEGDKWTLTMELPTGKHEFKVGKKKTKTDELLVPFGYNAVANRRALLLRAAAAWHACCRLPVLLARGVAPGVLLEPHSPPA